MASFDEIMSAHHSKVIKANFEKLDKEILGMTTAEPITLNEEIIQDFEEKKSEILEWVEEYRLKSNRCNNFITNFMSNQHLPVSVTYSFIEEKFTELNFSVVGEINLRTINL